MLTLKNYQRECLDQLRAYLDIVGTYGADTAFYHLTKIPYRPVRNLPGLPYVCLRVPTGGGKTVMACYALGVVTETYLQQEHAVCLWLVPSNAILEQTLKALKDKGHPYRQVLDAQFGGKVAVMDLSEALYVQRGTLQGDTCIIVSTLAAPRIENTEGRKIYESAGALQHHFTGLQPSLEGKLDRDDNGTVAYSLANVLKLWEPVIIVDEAHNARTPLSFDTLVRFAPSCIIEMTATPQMEHNPTENKYASNVLTHVSAAQLKAEEMIKLPIKLHTRPDWMEVLSDTVDLQRDLETVAKQELEATGEYIRPIVLLQSQPKREGKNTTTADVLKAALVGDLKVPEDQIAIATGATREIRGVDLFDPACSIRFIITQQALKEGWDCSFAYIFMSVADVGSAKEVEQLLGRVLRLPKAKAKKHDDLNRAYAMISSPRFTETLGSLAEALVENGFERIEAKAFITEAEQLALGLERLPLFTPHEVTEEVPEPPDLTKLDGGLREKVAYLPEQKKLVITGSLSPEERTTLEGCFTSTEGKMAVGRIYEKARGRATSSTAVAAPIVVPALCIKVQGAFEWFEESHFLDGTWNLATCNPILTEQEFPSEIEAGAEGEVDVNDMGKVEARFIQGIRQQLTLLRGEPDWTIQGLVNWLDRSFDHPDIIRAHSTLFIQKVIETLMAVRTVSLDQLAQEKYRLSRAIQELVDRHRAAMRNLGFQRTLFEAGAGVAHAEIETRTDHPLIIGQDRYAPNWYYCGAYRFTKHAFPTVGELKSEGEEFECAQFLDQLPQVKRWVRNLERRPVASFWLQTSTDKFYPDFVAELVDGRILVVEYKGEYLWGNDDSVEKRKLGALWADRSNEECIFVMPMGKDLAAISAAIQSS